MGRGGAGASEGALEGIPRGWCSGAEQILFGSGPLGGCPPAACGQGSRRIRV